MLAYITRRLVYGFVTLLALSIIVFFLLQASGGGPLDRLKLNPRIGPEFLEQLTRLWGLDQPLWKQYLTWAKNFVTPTTFAITSWTAYLALAIGAGFTLFAAFGKVDRPWWDTGRWLMTVAVWIGVIWFFKGRMEFALKWGDSFRGDGPVWDNIFGAAGATFRLGFSALFLALAIGIPLGIYQATRQYSFFDQVGTTFSFLAFSTPIFIIGVGLQLIMALYMERWIGVKLFYVAGMTSPGYEDLSFWARLGDVFQHLTLPALSIALISTAAYARFQRASMLEVLHSDYLRTAKAKGLPRRRVLIKHALRNALIPIVTLVSLDVATIIGGAIITESIFGWPGVGRLYLGAINAVDYPMVMAVVMVIAIGIVVMNVVADILYGVLDPRVRYD